MNISLRVEVGLFGTDTLVRFLHKIYKNNMKANLVIILDTNDK